MIEDDEDDESLYQDTWCKVQFIYIYMVNHGSLFCSNMNPIYVDLSHLRNLRHVIYVIYVSVFNLSTPLRGCGAFLQGFFALRKWRPWICWTCILLIWSFWVNILSNEMCFSDASQMSPQWDMPLRCLSDVFSMRYASQMPLRCLLNEICLSYVSSMRYMPLRCLSYASSMR
jgi:hypothetical protein